MMANIKCMSPALFRYTWPGQDESFCCLLHGNQIASVASAIGLHLQLIELQPGEIHDRACQNEEPAGEEV